MALVTLTGYYAGVVFAVAKNMAAHNQLHATEISKVWRCGVANSQTVAVTGVLCQLEVRKYITNASLTTPTAITPTLHDTADTGFTNAVWAHAGTIVGTLAGIFRRVFWSSDEAAISTGTLDELETFVPLNTIFDAGYGDTNVKPMTIRQNQMFLLANNAGAAGLLDTWMEVTKE